MLEFVLGILVSLMMFSMAYVGFVIGKKQIPITEPPKLSEVEKKKFEQIAELNEGMNKVLNYSEADARKHYRG